MDPKIFFIFTVSFVTCFIVTKFFIRRFKEIGREPYVVPDMNKKNKPPVPNLGGLGIISGILSGLIVSQLLITDIHIITKLLIFYFIVITYGLFALIDDLIDIGKKSKIIIPFFLALPIGLLNTDTTLSLLFFEIELGPIYPLLLSPLYLMVVANLENMHSGFNGLESGLASILFLTILAKIIIEGEIGNIYFIMPILGSILAFLYFDRYPSKIFLGNIGSYTLGSALGGLIILNDIELFGVVILIPHIINFLMAVYIELIKGYKKKENIFVELREDGTVKAPSYPSLKWFPAYFFRLTEKQLTYIMYCITSIFCVIGLVFF